MSPTYQSGRGPKKCTSRLPCLDDVTYVGIDLLRNLNPSKIKVMVAKRSKKKSTKTPEMIRIIGSFEPESSDPTVKNTLDTVYSNWVIYYYASCS
jgi:hypothetical protein